MDNTKYIYITLHNGLGNRLLPLVSAIRFSRMTNRVVRCYWTSNPGRSYFEYEGDCTFLDLFQPVDKLEFFSETKFMEHINGNAFNFYDFYFANKPNYLVDINSKDDIFIYNSFCSMYTKEDGSHDMRTLGTQEPCQSFTSFISSYKQFFKELKPIEELQNTINCIQSSFTDKMIGIHIRRSDGGFAYKNWKESDPLLVDKVNMWISQGYTIFLACDDPRYETLFGGKNIIINKQSGKYNNDKINTMNAVVDMYLLSYCPTIIGTYDSTFSMVSYFLSENSVLWMVNTDPESVRRINV